MFHVAQEVVCVNDDENATPTVPGIHYLPGLDGLRRGATYTIRAVGTSPHGGYPIVWLNEIVRPYSRSYGGEGGYAAIRFRPVQKKQLPESLTRLLDLPKDVEVA